MVMRRARPAEGYVMRKKDLIEERRTGSVIGAFFEVYNNLPFGYLESLYAAALERELIARGHCVAREYGVRVYYKGEPLGFHRIDILVDDIIVVEVKSTRRLDESASRQLLNYLRATNLEVGLLLHFGPKPRFYRVICENELKQHTNLIRSNPYDPSDPRPPFD